MAWGREMFVEGQDSVKKELFKCFSTEDFSQTDDIFPEEEQDDEQDEGQNKDNPLNRISRDDVIDENVTEAQEEETEDIHPPM